MTYHLVKAAFDKRGDFLTNQLWLMSNLRFLGKA